MIKLTIDGATCGGCVKSIEKAIQGVEGVGKVSFNLESKIAEVSGDAPIAAIVDAVEIAGFDVTETQES